MQSTLYIRAQYFCLSFVYCVTFVCFVFIQQFTLKTVCACPGACDESGPVGPCTSGGGGGIGGGTIFLIM